MDCKWFLVCPMKRFYEEKRLDKKWIELYYKGDWKSCGRYQQNKNYYLQRYDGIRSIGLKR